MLLFQDWLFYMITLQHFNVLYVRRGGFLLCSVFFFNLGSQQKRNMTKIEKCKVKEKIVFITGNEVEMLKKKP